MPPACFCTIWDLFPRPRFGGLGQDRVSQRPHPVFRQRTTSLHGQHISQNPAVEFSAASPGKPGTHPTLALDSIPRDRTTVEFGIIPESRISRVGLVWLEIARVLAARTVSSLVCLLRRSSSHSSKCQPFGSSWCSRSSLCRLQPLPAGHYARGHCSPRALPDPAMGGAPRAAWCGLQRSKISKSRL